MPRKRRTPTGTDQGRQGAAKRPSGTGGGGGATVNLILCGLLLVVLVGAGIAITATDVRLALGHTGTLGTATVTSCTPVRKGLHCTAHFAFDDRAREPILVDTVADVQVGEVFPAVLTPEEDLVLPAGTRGVWRAILPLVAIPFGIALIAFLSALVIRSRKGILWTGALLLPPTIAMIIGFVAGS
ncbi:hypothetical protein [Rhizohabitans arisaemae]|uniref:hypothetical protein n=1 Tax=Rhizohabitans arisaemae TaxID=2720610 RepID=UPI0024B24FAD|nr:hypothetical protein [Rhizohabitans arisaemae]